MLQKRLFLTLSELIAAAYLKATGEVSTLTSSDDDWEKLRQIANLYVNSWATEPGVDWQSLYSTVDSGTVSATDTFDLDDTIRKISGQEGDYVRIVHTNGNYSDYQVVSPDKFKQYPTGSICTQIGRQLVFNAPFTSSSPQFGGTIKVPSYILPDPLQNAADEVPVNNPNWLVYMCAAEYVRNDITRAQQYPNLIAEANDLMGSMKSENNAQLSQTYRSPAVNPNGVSW